MAYCKTYLFGNASTSSEFAEDHAGKFSFHLNKVRAVLELSEPNLVLNSGNLKAEWNSTDGNA